MKVLKKYQQEKKLPFDFQIVTDSGTIYQYIEVKTRVTPDNEEADIDMKFIASVKEIEMALNTPNYTFLWIHFVKIENGNKKTPLFALKNYYLIDSNLIKSPGLFTFLLSKSNNV